ncbi:MAG: hypothetical protein Kow0099_19300 [Candidatus Abyssubacteria bacterium]
MAEPEIERRKQPRVRADDGVSIGIDAQVTGVQVRDISLSGLCFRLGHPLDFMTRLMITLVFPHDRPQNRGSALDDAIQCEGAVVRCEQVNDDYGTRYEVAVFFTKLDETARRAIDRYVKTHV